MPGQPIPVTTAENMIKEYYDYMTKLGVDMHDQTQSVSFSSNDLMDYLSHTMPLADELRVFMGVYPDGHQHAGRTTVILWPYNNGQPALNSNNNTIEPFNEGAGLP